MRYRLLGALEVETDEGVPVAIVAPKRRALLAALLIGADRPQSADHLVDLLWGSEPPPAARASLHAHISRLRREIGRAAIQSSSAGYQIRLRDGDLDVRLFERRLEGGRRAAAEGRWLAARADLQAALDLWRGPALADAADDVFGAAEMARLEELRMTALEQRVEADLALGRHRDVVAELEAIVAEHPLLERFWYQLMLALYRSGRQAHALSAYRRLRSTLVDELGLDPSPDLQALEVKILRHDPSLDGPAVQVSAIEVSLPLLMTSFVGRRTELDQATRLLAVRRLLTLTGPGGVGKTHLAIVIAHGLVGSHPDGVVFVDLSSVREPAQVLAKIGASLGGSDRPAKVIGGRRMLLVLDNFEQVLDAAPDVTRLLEACRELRIIVTSRAPLRIRGEQQQEVPPLDTAQSVELFDARVLDATRSAYAGDDVVAAIIERLDGLPLAIELAAARVRQLSPEDLRDRLVERLSLLTAGPRDAPQRHRTLTETIAWSYDLLNQRSQSAFRDLAVLTGDFDLDAALAVTQVDLDSLVALVDQSLMRRVSNRYSLLDTIREFASTRLDASGGSDSARDRHLAHFLTVATSTSRQTTDGGPLGRNAWLVMCRAERENLRLAFDWAAARNDHEAVVRLFRSIGLYWLIVGAVDEGERWAGIAMRAAHHVGDEARRMSTLMIASEYPRFGGDPRRARMLKLEALAIAREIEDRSAVTTILGDLASVASAMGDFDGAHAWLDESLAIHDRHDDDARRRAHTVEVLVELALLEGDVVAARGRFAELCRLESQLDLNPDWVVEFGPAARQSASILGCRA